MLLCACGHSSFIFSAYISLFRFSLSLFLSRFLSVTLSTNSLYLSLSHLLSRSLSIALSLQALSRFLSVSLFFFYLYPSSLLLTTLILHFSFCVCFHIISCNLAVYLHLHITLSRSICLHIFVYRTQFLFSSVYPALYDSARSHPPSSLSIVLRASISVPITATSHYVQYPYSLNTDSCFRSFQSFKKLKAKTMNAHSRSIRKAFLAELGALVKTMKKQIHTI